MEKETPPLLVIVGPTASGKSKLALELAERYNGELICADSQTIRRDMNIGTAKPTKEEQANVRHHLLDIINPYEDYSAAKFKAAANEAITDIASRGKLPVMVGGTGLYVDAVVYDFHFAEPANPQKREALNAKTIEQLQQMHEVQGISLPVNFQNKRHLVRSLESGGLKALDKNLRPNTFIIGLDLPKEELDERIELRVGQMLKEGFIEEVKQITEKYGYPPLNWDAIGYKVVLQWLDWGNGESVEDMEYIRRALITATRQYAKRQRSWFRRNQAIHWATDGASALALAANWPMANMNSGQNKTTGIDA